jgi:hypothetical protein
VALTLLLRRRLIIIVYVYHSERSGKLINLKKDAWRRLNIKRWLECFVICVGICFLHNMNRLDSVAFAHSCIQHKYIHNIKVKYARPLTGIT